MTGLTAFTIYEDKIDHVESYELDFVGVGRYFEQHKITPDTIIAYEVANKLQASGHVSSEVIGIVKYFTEINGANIVPVTQSAWKRLVTRDVIKRAGLNVKGTHAKDAAGIGLFQALRLHLVRWTLTAPEEE